MLPSRSLQSCPAAITRLPGQLQMSKAAGVDGCADCLCCPQEQAGCTKVHKPSDKVTSQGHTTSDLPDPQGNLGAKQELLSI